MTESQANKQAAPTRAASSALHGAPVDPTPATRRPVMERASGRTGLL
jgi:hypothetical protein